MVKTAAIILALSFALSACFPAPPGVVKNVVDTIDKVISQ